MACAAAALIMPVCITVTSNLLIAGTYLIHMNAL